MTHSDVTLALGFGPTELAEGDLEVISPIDGELIGRVTTPQEVASMIAIGSRLSIHGGTFRLRDVESLSVCLEMSCANAKSRLRASCPPNAARYSRKA